MSPARQPVRRRPGETRDGRDRAKSAPPVPIRTTGGARGDDARRDAGRHGVLERQVALVHGMSRPIGAFFHVPHGLSNAMLLPDITAFSAPAALHRYADCARAMGVADDPEGDQSAVARLLDELRGSTASSRCRAGGVGHRRGALGGAGAGDGAQAAASGSPANNPRVPTPWRSSNCTEGCTSSVDDVVAMNPPIRRPETLDSGIGVDAIFPLNKGVLDRLRTSKPLFTPSHSTSSCSHLT